MQQVKATDLSIILKCNLYFTAYQQQSWTSRVTADSDFSCFINIQNAVSKAKICSYPTNSTDLHTAFFMAKFISTVPDFNVKICRLCKKQYIDMFEPVCCNCPYSFEIQNIWWDLIIENFCLGLYVELSSYDDEALYQILLEKKTLLNSIITHNICNIYYFYKVLFHQACDF